MRVKRQLGRIASLLLHLRPSPPLRAGSAKVFGEGDVEAEIEGGKYVVTVIAKPEFPRFHAGSMYGLRAVVFVRELFELLGRSKL
jgi:hypothetical protein